MKVYRPNDKTDFIVMMSSNLRAQSPPGGEERVPQTSPAGFEKCEYFAPSSEFSHFFFLNPIMTTSTGIPGVLAGCIEQSLQGVFRGFRNVFLGSPQRS